MKLLLTLLLVIATLFARNDASRVFSVGSPGSEDPHACGPRSVGLIDGDTAKWLPGSCIAVDDWINDAETANMLESGVVVVYTNPGFGQDTDFYFVDFSSKNVSRVLVGGDQGEMRCVADADRLSCYGVSPGDDNDDTQLIEVDGHTGDSRPVLNLTDYEGYSVGGSVIDPVNMHYHFIAVGNPHLFAPPPPASTAAPPSQPMPPRRRCKRGTRCSPPRSAAPLPSDQWLVTINLKQMKIVAQAPLSRNFMGPLSISEAHVRNSGFGMLCFCLQLPNSWRRVWPRSTLKDITDLSRLTTRAASCCRFCSPTSAASCSFAAHSPEIPPSPPAPFPAPRAFTLCIFPPPALLRWLQTRRLSLMA
jgi:hypothetical protein